MSLCHQKAIIWDTLIENKRRNKYRICFSQWKVSHSPFHWKMTRSLLFIKLYWQGRSYLNQCWSCSTTLYPAATRGSESRSLKTILYMPYTLKLNVDLVYVSECVMQDHLVCVPCQWDDVTMQYRLPLASHMHREIPGYVYNYMILLQ